MRSFAISLGSIVLLTLTACGPQSPPPTETPAEPAASPPAEASSETSTETPQDLFWNHLTALCGKAFQGAMTSDDAVDQQFAEQTMVMHVRQCFDDRIEIPLHVGEDRSRTWVLTRLDDGLLLKHDHRHEDGSEDATTQYGGRTLDAGSPTSQSFPADDYSKELFTSTDREALTANTWSLEIEPGKTFSYRLKRPGRFFQADFDLSATVDAPPTPWGH